MISHNYPLFADGYLARQLMREAFPLLFPVSMCIEVESAHRGMPHPRMADRLFAT
jgi:hypothetical protein